MAQEYIQLYDKVEHHNKDDEENRLNLEISKVKIKNFINNIRETL